MKNLITISPNATNYQFNLKTIEDALFSNKNPLVTVFPFPINSLKKISVTFEVPFLYNESLEIRQIVNYVKKIDNKETRISDKESTIYKFPFILLPLITVSFTRIVTAWYSYLFDNLKEFSDTEVSLINWKVIQSNGISFIFKNELSLLQKLWISLNAQNDREFWLKTATDIRETLLPWLNYDLWSKIEKNKENTRENADYEEQKRAMVEGRIKDIDVAPELAQNVIKQLNEEDLDIIT